MQGRFSELIDKRQRLALSDEELRERQETSFTSCSLFEFGEMV